MEMSSHEFDRYATASPSLTVSREAKDERQQQRQKRQHEINSSRKSRDGSSLVVKLTCYCCCGCVKRLASRRQQISSSTTTTSRPPHAKDGEMGARNVKDAESKLLWKPEGAKDHLQLELLRNAINKEHGVALVDYHQLHQWSVENYDLFWEILWRWFDVKCSAKPRLPVIDKTASMDSIPRWFADARLNYAENLLRYPQDDKTAYFYTSERVRDVGVRSKTFGQVRRRVAFLAQALRRHGVVSGDRVAGYLPNFPESIELMAATASIGAIWSSTSPDFGVSGVLDRFKQIRPKIIFSVEAVSYNAKKHDNLGKLRQVVQGLGAGGLERVVVIPYCSSEASIELKDFGDGVKVCLLSEFVGDEGGPTPHIVYEQVSFHHPLFIMYSSGTTGAPKCMVHSVGGTLMKHLEEHQIQGNRGDKDVLLYYTTVGWMMWNWMVTALSLGTTLVLYDGSPLLPHDAALWDLVDQCQITVFGTSAKWIAVQEDRNVKPRETHKLTSLKTICSTGSPLMPHSFDYIYRDIKENVHVASISGGTDIIACFMGENTVLPVHRGEIQSAHLGCAVECWDDDGKRLEDGESGELVITKPFPSMPVNFWNDPDGALYRAAYFNKYAGVWAHGDFLLIDKETKGMVMLGRSDGTLNPNGVRFGSAEIYSIIETFDEVEDSLCVGQRLPAAADNEERVILFLKMDKGAEMGVELVQRIKAKIRTELSARHVPALVLPIADIPYTVNGKKVEVAVKNVMAGREVKNATALANPESLELYRNIPETKTW